MCRIHHSGCDSHSTQPFGRVSSACLPDCPLCRTARPFVQHHSSTAHTTQHSLQTPRRRTFCSTAAAAASMSWEQMLQLCSQSSAALLPAMELSRLLLLADATIYSSSFSSFSSSRFTHSIAAPYALLPPPPSPPRRRRTADCTTCTE